MIYLKKGQPLADASNILVYDATGYYNDGDSVICAGIGAPEEPAYRYEAKYIAYGGMVYSISDPDLLLKQVLELDPKSLFGKDSQQVAIDKIVEDIVPQKTENLEVEPEKIEEEKIEEEETPPEPTTEEVDVPLPEVVIPETTPVIPTTPTSTPTSIPTTPPTPEVVLPETTPVIPTEPII